MTEGLSAADVMALTKEGDGMGNMWNNPQLTLRNLWSYRTW